MQFRDKQTDDQAGSVPWPRPETGKQIQPRAHLAPSHFGTSGTFPYHQDVERETGTHLNVSE